MDARFNDTTNLVKYLAGLRSTQVATIVAITEVRLNKRDTATKTIRNPFPEGVRKVQTIRVTVNDQYENKVNDVREAEGKEADFVVAPLQWGEHVSNCVIENNGQLYVQTLVVERDDAPVYLSAATGEHIPFAQVQPFMPPRNTSNRQGLEDEIKVCTWKLSSIHALWMGDKLIYKSPE